MKGKTADYHMLVRMIREIKVPRDRFRCVLVVFLYVSMFRSPVWPGLYDVSKCHTTLLCTFILHGRQLIAHMSLSVVFQYSRFTQSRFFLNQGFSESPSVRIFI